MENIITKAELRAFQIMTKDYFYITNNFTFNEIREKADELILLAEKIKAERMSVAMNK